MTPLMREMRILRKGAGLTQVQWGKLLGISGNQISRIEKGRNRTTPTIIRLARFLAESRK